MTKAAGDRGVTEFTARFLYSEWTNVVDAWQLDSEAAYTEAPRLGRKNRLSVRHHKPRALRLRAQRHVAATPDSPAICRLWRAKRNCFGKNPASAFDPKRTSPTSLKTVIEQRAS